MRNFMFDLCVSSLVAGAVLAPQYARGAGNEVAAAAAGKVDAKYLSYPVYEGDGLA